MTAPTDRRPPAAATPSAERLDPHRATRSFGLEPATIATVLGLLAVLLAGSQSCSGAITRLVALERPLVSAH